jgi:hypothetical protein
VFFLLLQVTVTLTAGGGRQGRRRLSRSTDFWSPSAAARASDGGALEHAPPAFLHTIPAGRGFLCNFWSFGGLICKFWII